MEQIGRYRILGELGRGGMATVFRAFDPNVDREVAVKVLPPQFMHDANFRKRFMREAKVIARLEHSAIVPIYDFGEQDGQPYLVMRYLTGGTLAERIQSGALSIPEASEIINRVASALEEAHSRAIVHRDLKPGNILFDSNGEAFLSDFGIVKLAEASAALTGTGVVGTPTYMSPEQAYGARDIDGRSDIYSMGIILYEMLTGSTPYEADTPMGVAMKHILEPVPNIFDKNPDLPKSVGVLLDRALAKKREHRFLTATEFADVLATIAQGKTPDIQPVEPDPIDPTTLTMPEAIARPTQEVLPQAPIQPSQEAGPPLSKKEQRQKQRAEKKAQRRGVPWGVVILIVLGGLMMTLCVGLIAFSQGVTVTLENVLGGGSASGNFSGERTTNEIAQSSNGAEELIIQLDLGSTNTDVSGEEMDLVFSGNYEHPIELDDIQLAYTVEDSVGEAVIKQPTAEFDFAGLRPGIIPTLDLNVTNALPVMLNINAGFGSLEIDLSDIQVQTLDINGAGGLVDVTLPENGELALSISSTAGGLTLNSPFDATDLTITEFEVFTGAGESTIQIPGAGGFTLDIETGVGSTILEVPADVPIRITARQGSGNISNNYDGLAQVTDGTWETEGFDPEAPNAVIVEARISLGDLTINER